MATASPPSMDWQTGKTLSECFEYILTSGIASDVTFLVGKDRKRIFAHKLVLISRSPVFYAMFEGPMAEKGDVTVPDISEDAFQVFLKYLYTDNIDLTQENTVPVLSVARKYCVDILVSRCEEFLNKTLSADNACLFLELAHEFLMENLQTKCRQLIYDSPDVILQSSSFADLCRSCVTSITESDDLQVGESDVYNAVVMWAEAECKRQNLEVTPDNKRNVLGDILYTVRFPVMESDFFIEEVCHHKVLPAEDVVQTINYQRHQEKVSVSKLNYNKRKTDMIKQRLWRGEGITHSQWTDGMELRCEGITRSQWTDGMELRCEGITHSQWTDDMEFASFTVSDNIQLLGFGSFYSHGDNTVNVDIYENYKLLYKAANMSRVKSKNNHIGKVLLKPSEYILLKPGSVYTIKEYTKHNRKCYSQHTTGHTSRCGPTTTITFTMPYVEAYNRMQVPYLLLK